MIKARLRGTDGRPLYVLGLSQLNIAKLLKGRPIVFDGGELGLYGRQFLIALAANRAEASALSALHSRGDPRKLVSLCFDPEALDGLRTEPVELNGGPFQLDGDILLIYCETEQALAAALGFPRDPLPPGYRDELDPLTGLVQRRRVEDA